MNITISKYGDTLVISSKGNRVTKYEKLLHRNKEIHEVILGTHEICGGLITSRGISKSHRALLCRKCCFRKEYPITILKLGDLDKHFSLQFSGQ